MKIYKEGDKLSTGCHACKKRVDSTFLYRDVPFSDGSGVVPNILAAVCDECGTVVATPPQSTPAIRKAKAQKDIPLEVALPAPDLDILDAAAYRLDSSATPKFRKSLIAYYVHKLSSDPDGKARLKETISRLTKSEKKIADAKAPKRRLSCKIAPRTDRSIKQLMEESGAKKTRLIRGLVREIEHDIVRPDHPKELEKLRDIVSVVNA